MPPQDLPQGVFPPSGTLSDGAAFSLNRVGGTYCWEPFDRPVPNLEAAQTGLDNRATDSDNEAQRMRYQAKGNELLKNGRVAVLMFAGGESTRYGAFRGNERLWLPSGNTTLFGLQGAKIATLRRHYKKAVPWLVLTSSAVHQETQLAFERGNWFGMPSNEVFLFPQQSLPVLDEQFQPIRQGWMYRVSPTGHGGMLRALAESGALRRLQEEKIEHLYSFIYPNVLDRICDPVLLGYHAIEGCDATIKAIQECPKGQKMGRVKRAGDMTVIREYYHLPDDEPGPASIGDYLWKVSFLRECWEKFSQAGTDLPYYTLKRPDPERGGDLWKLEQFAFDLLWETKKTGLVLVSEKAEYCPIKRPTDLPVAQKAVEDAYPNGEFLPPGSE